MINILESKVIRNEYNKDNYFIILNNKTKDTPIKLCVIYFSSNDIWYPNTEQEFINSIIVSNRYEWKNIRIHKAQKEIFIRDIYKSWYTLGINSRLNSIDAVMSFLRKETSGYNVVTVGSSAGGYMAALTASLLNAQYAICFSPQFDITSEIENNPILQKYQKFNASKYYSIADYIRKSPTNIFYLFPHRNFSDLQQSRYVKDITQVHSLPFSSARHGVILPGKCVLRLINMDMPELMHIFSVYNGKTISPLRFTLQQIGIFETFNVILLYFIKMIRSYVDNVKKRNETAISNNANV